MVVIIPGLVDERLIVPFAGLVSTRTLISLRGESRVPVLSKQNSDSTSIRNKISAGTVDCGYTKKSKSPCVYAR